MPSRNFTTSNAMKQMQMKLNFSTDTVMLKEEEIDLDCMSSGHYCLPLSVFNLDSDSCNITLTVIEGNLSHKEKQTKALKLHRQFGHADASRLKQLVRNSNLNDNEFEQCIQDVCDECET